MFFNFEKKQKTLNTTHLLKLLDNVCKYEMDPGSIVEDTERIPFCPQTDGQGETSIPCFNFVKRGGGGRVLGITKGGVLNPCLLSHWSQRDLDGILDE